MDFSAAFELLSELYCGWPPQDILPNAFRNTQQGLFHLNKLKSLGASSWSFLTSAWPDRVILQTKMYNKWSPAANTSIKASVIILGLGLAMEVPALAEPTQIWFAPMDPRHGLGSSDFMDLFDPIVLWPQTALSINVFKLYYQFILYSSDEKLKQVTDFLRAHNIALAIEVAILTPSGRCGRVEGYASMADTVSIIQHLNRAGADLRYIAMDEPLWFGHRDQTPAGCRSSIESIVQNAASTAAVFRDAFPEVRIGDIEPIPANSASMISDTALFAERWEILTGHKLDFMILDLSLMVNWIDTIRSTSGMLKAHGIPLGIIYNGSGADSSDAAWLNRAEQRYESWEDSGRPSPTIALFQSWNSYPTHVLPEIMPLSFTHLLLGYNRQRAMLQVVRDADEVRGRLTNSSGVGIVGAELSVGRLDTSTLGETQSVTFSGTVPSDAYQVIFVVRINDPECTCVGPADVDITHIRYNETPDSLGQRSVAVVNWHGNAKVQQSSDVDSLHIVARRDENVRVNTSSLSVTPTSTYSAQLDLRVSADSQGNGYVGVAFINRQGRELTRNIHPFSAMVKPVGTIITDLDGTFKLGVPTPYSRLQIRFWGNQQVRGGVSVVP